MVILEDVFLKNIVLYLPTFHDISTFIRINKKANQIVKTLFINPYFTSLIKCESDIKLLKILFYFPMIQTVQVQYHDLGYIESTLKGIEQIFIQYRIDDDLSQFSDTTFLYPRLLNYKGDIKKIQNQMDKLQRITLINSSTCDLKYIINHISFFPHLKQITICLDYGSDTIDIEKYIKQLIELSIDVNINYESIEDFEFIESLRNKVPLSVKHFFYSFCPFSVVDSSIFVFLNSISSYFYDSYLTENASSFQQYYYPMNYKGFLIASYYPFNSLTSLTIKTPTPTIPTIGLSPSLIELTFPSDFITPNLPNLSTLTHLHSISLGILKTHLKFPLSLTSLTISHSETCFECPSNLQVLNLSSYTKNFKINKTLQSLSINKLNRSMNIPQTLQNLSIKCIANISLCSSITCLSIFIEKIVVVDDFFIEIFGKYIFRYPVPPLLKQLSILNCRCVDAISLPSSITSLNITMNADKQIPKDIPKLLKIPKTIPKVSILFQFENFQRYNIFHKIFENNALQVVRNIYRTISSISLERCSSCDLEE
ncbi:hypothetical protein EHI8A_013080 [Entamoeba histolytica HM-1:IMSS-B]|uniref:Leucine-rich repeat containing protein n=6 Tax=Entamoeba histolytica TaxID=5759 RepID=C4LYN7_ENTH1|nr:hypothetical protein EHI_118890 [Entamoeba histolytica HM-1:IMSS]EMD48253.1 Hypothetical protein EHI5A_001910 [Entamoeba histolytica KU27]EMH76965.1 hypothetical protein EHI8A_013080 [Entamoeba histolytica HM-1:IMSS-B]EMS15031.1 hypothetical protein KM1_001290 [Entamoeba histolytica HM-3:IMSS]ENY63035.1 hypothetical protein EHI7A_016540 [Entamoeba histolytica HM-1:IMSS-A]GAT93944.1 hypothetical protein CL6EHI_118890 [Entamoeba histolytica]|eukprot:XP_654106.1 hypothetical protein EHI_118890 [Entamoeba histolytica HM-1:IMSS]